MLAGLLPAEFTIKPLLMRITAYLQALRWHKIPVIKVIARKASKLFSRKKSQKEKN